MIAIENHIGKITVSNRYLTDLIWYTVTNCFGVAGMNFSSVREELGTLVCKDKAKRKGVVIRSADNKLIIDLHITVTFGTRISAVVDSISNKVRFAVEEATGVAVSKVNVFIDNMNS